MGLRLIRRRRDGLVEIRRARARDLVVSTDTGVLLVLLGGWLLFVVALVAALLFDPPALGLIAWAIVFLLVEQRHNRAQPIAEPHATPPPRSVA